MDTKELVKIALTGHDIKYNKKQHLALLIDALAQMKGIEYFCAEAGICKKTFHRWLKKYPDFKKAYDLGLPRGESVWSSIPFSKKGRDINVLAWRLIGQNRYGFGKARIDSSANLGFAAKCLALQDALNEGEIDAQGYATIMSGYVTELKGKILDKTLSKGKDKDTPDISNMSEEELVAYIIASKT